MAVASPPIAHLQPTARIWCAAGGVATLERVTTTACDDVLEFYTDRCDESLRLTTTLRGQLEAVRMRELLSEYLPEPPGPVADVGGGTGAHAVWLQRAGYPVDLLDPVPRHIEAARRAGVRSAVLGDARALPWPDASYAMVLLAGPLYHLAPRDRMIALAEAVRVSRPGAIVVAVAVNRFANLIGATLANQLTDRSAVVGDILSTGHSRSNDRVPGMYYHSPAELRGEFAAAGLTGIGVRGLTGPGGWLTVTVDRHFPPGTPIPPSLTTPDPLVTALAGARAADRHPELIASSAQLLAIGTVQ